MTDEAQRLKIAAAAQALSHVQNGMRLGIGSGSTAEEFVRLLAVRVKEGLQIIGVPTSERTAALCQQQGVPLTTLDETPHLDLTIDGADELDADLTLIKGGGGALLREKIVAAASDAMIVIADQSKLVDILGRFALPIEVNRFGLAATMQAIGQVAQKSGLAGSLTLRVKDKTAFVTDGGHFIVDASFGRIPNPQTLSDALFAIPGVVEHGLFIGLARTAVIAGTDGIRTMNRS